MQLYYLNINVIRKNISKLSERITPLRRARMNAMMFEDDRLRCLGAGLLLTDIIFNGDINSVKVKTGIHGKPYIEGKLNFNLSHSGDYVIMLVDNEPVGCDVQKMIKNRDFKSIMNYLFHSKEISYVENSNNETDAFYRVWCLRESVLKASGMGLNLENNGFYFTFGRKIRLNKFQQPEFCFFHEILHDDYRVALCGIKPFNNIKILSFIPNC